VYLYDYIHTLAMRVIYYHNNVFGTGPCNYDLNTLIVQVTEVRVTKTWQVPKN